jgi:hypothetical protein
VNLSKQFCAPGARVNAFSKGPAPYRRQHNAKRIDGLVTDFVRPSVTAARTVA